MGLFKRIIMEIIRRPFRAVILAIMIFTLSIASMIGVFLKDIVNTAYQEYIKLDGYSVAIENSTQESIPYAVIDNILAMDHVIGYNNNGNLYDKYSPVNFINVPYEGSQDKQSEESTDIILYANMDTSLYSMFQNGDMILSEGVYPDSNHRGVLIDEALATKNVLGIGDDINLYSKSYGKVVTFEIIGIYQTIEAPDAQIRNDLGTYYTISASSYIFCDYNSFFSVSDRNDTVSSLVFYIDEYDNIESVYKKIGDIVLPKGYIVINRLENTLSYYGKFILTLKNTTSYLLGFTYSTSIFILFLMTLLWMRDHYYETGIYIALGTEKYKIVLYYVLEILTIAISTLFISLITGRSFIYTYRYQLLKLALGFTNSTILDTSIKSKVLEHSFSFQSLLHASGSYLIIVVIATLLSSTIITHYNPRRLFDNQ